MARVIIQKGGVAGGYLACDGRNHFWIYADYQKYGLREKTLVGRCPNAEACKVIAADLIQREKEEEDKKAALAAKAVEPVQKG